MSSPARHTDHRESAPGQASGQGIRIRNLNKSFGKKHVLRDIAVDFAPDRVHGLLGANGVGKTTLMSVILNHTFRSSGEVLIDGEDPRENARLLERTCFIHEGQKFHDDDTPASLLRILPTFYPAWDTELAERLASRFKLPMSTRTTKLSRGQRSALAIVISLAARAPYTFMDEPYLGLDPGHRALFYEEFARALAEHPRTVILSTHLIDEVSDLLEDVVMIEDGRVTVDADIDDARDSAFVLRGLEPVVRDVVGARRNLALYLTNRLSSFVVAPAILVLVAILTVVIGLIIGIRTGLPLPQPVQDGFQANLAVFWALPGFLISHGALTANRGFAGALAFGSTRRNFWAGTAMGFMITSLVVAAVGLVILAVEAATGFGLGISFLTIHALGDGSPLIVAWPDFWLDLASELGRWDIPLGLVVVTLIAGIAGRAVVRYAEI